MTTETYHLGDRADLLGFLPYALGFHPADSLVMVGLRDKRIVLYARDDLRPDAAGSAEAFARILWRAPGISELVLVAYGSAKVAREHPRSVCAAMESRGYRVADALRVENSRYHCLLCTECTPPDGQPFDRASTAGAAYGAYSGLVALPDREAVGRQVRPVGGPARIAMSQATDRAEKRLGQLVSAAQEPARTLYDAGTSAVDEALATHERGGRLSDDQVAWLSTLLHDLRVRDHAWLSSDAGQLGLWLDVTRRADPPLAAPPATLLGWCAWRDAQPVLAEAALCRAERIDPQYTLTPLLLTAVREGLPPRMADGWRAKHRGEAGAAARQRGRRRAGRRPGR